MWFVTGVCEVPSMDPVDHMLLSCGASMLQPGDRHLLGSELECGSVDSCAYAGREHPCRTLTSMIGALVGPYMGGF